MNESQHDAPEDRRPLAGCYRSLWMPDAAVLLAVAAVAAMLSITRLDVAAQRLFFAGATAADAWPLQNVTAAVWLRQVAPWPAILAAAGAAGALALAAAGRMSPRWRVHCAYILLAISLGPGLTVNAVFKQHWGRPRPRETVGLGGTQPFQRAFVKSDRMGNSFACGESSMGYVLTLFYFLARRRRLGRRLAILAAAAIFGTAVGFVRMLAGAHFLTDVLWSGVLAAGVNLVLYYFVLNVPAREDGKAPALAFFGSRRLFAAAAALVALGILGAVLFATPVHAPVRHEAAGARPGLALDIEVACPRGHVEVVLEPRGDVVAEGEARGFGPPGSRFSSSLTSEAAGTGWRVAYALRPRGPFTEVEAYVALRAPGADAVRLIVDSPGGEARVASSSTLPAALTVEVRRGRLVLPAAWKGRCSVASSARGASVVYGE